MRSIPKQLATFFAVLAVLYALGAIAGQFIEPESHDARDRQTLPHDER